MGCIQIQSLLLHLHIGEEGVFFEGDIRLKPGEDPYNILHSYRHRVSNRDVILTDEAGSGDHPTSDLDFTSLRTWPSHRIPFDYKPSLCKSVS